MQATSVIRMIGRQCGPDSGRLTRADSGFSRPSKAAIIARRTRPSPSWPPLT